ncbi:hypothetical protein WJX72_001095 [[Myrmecia] bisecta]|uniref:NAD(P)-dependent oxidoreductase n=1 Tax=[Myrmecia] bisecta TaxID=41462 RepID=A0AAW1Q084_9CHLO
MPGCKTSSLPLSAVHGRSAGAIDASWVARSNPDHLFVLGLGYLGLGCTKHVQAQGWQVAGTCRSAEKQQALQDAGILAYVFDPDNFDCLSAEGLRALRGATHILSTIPPVGDFDQDPVLSCQREDLISVAEQLQWVGYISSTSVYGDHQGNWVDERSELRADSGKGLARVHAEEAWQALYQHHGLPVHTFRLGGIYGPGRSALDAAQAKGPGSSSQQRRGRQSGQGIQASLRGDGQLIGESGDHNGNITQDTLPQAFSSSSSSYGSRLRTRLGPGPLEKRVCNLKVKQELGITLDFPTYQEGLRAIHGGNMQPFA